ncbi:hypothetical protein O0L34_g11711 [Tuta absoluta]|nr:hypothetical protein O0L34_g11711 [Tuta absoluta]
MYVLLSAELLSAHQLRHRQAKQFVCGYGDCVLRFGTRSNLMAHIRKCHAAELPDAEPEKPVENSCDQCDRSFASSAALKRHQRVHTRQQQYEEEQEEVIETEQPMEGVQYVIQTEGGEYIEGEEGEVEYLEVETLEDAEYILEEEEDDTKPDISRLQ